MRNFFIILTIAAFILYFAPLIINIFTKKCKSYVNRNWLYLAVGVATLLGFLFIPDNTMGGFFLKCVFAAWTLTIMPFLQLSWRLFVGFCVCVATSCWYNDEGKKIVYEHLNICFCIELMAVIMFFIYATGKAV